ncbi:MAG: hypothetical protein KY469_15445 [Actinobacteria bacterium]|nr:hypothetical protein [Actinomycetota bacterium]
MRRSLAALSLVLAFVGASCAEEEAQRDPVGPDDGLQLTGQLAGKRYAVSDGEPEVVHGDCDPNDGLDVDLCVIARTVDGQNFGVVFENPDALIPGETVPVSHVGCVAEQCDAHRDSVLLEVRVDGSPLPATGGNVTVTAAGPPRWTGELSVRFADGGGLSGSFNVQPGLID